MHQQGETTDGDQAEAQHAVQLGLGVEAGAGQARGTRGARAGHAGDGRAAAVAAATGGGDAGDHRGPAVAGAERDATGLAAAAVRRGDGETALLGGERRGGDTVGERGRRGAARVAERDRAGADRRVVRDDGGAGGEGLPHRGARRRRGDGDARRDLVRVRRAVGRRSGVRARHRQGRESEQRADESGGDRPGDGGVAHERAPGVWERMCGLCWTPQTRDRTVSITRQSCRRPCG